ncbi:hypothetical protein [Ligilactobacillus salivarius]|uniref:Uncharacterized protein n=1 Tax=Ligilactobacillus salivarius TaxID=1624 RepID=A0A1V9QL97_9LACO|nr:hypothetical protein [Ligilactobacillus salivarius]OQQ81625.1 hypothetical protein B6U60_09880 [Ligilactobacillus salivarius]OQQ84748.1 hypothetical protein B6U59_09075 [Ligilactobacillus salivarius]
MELLHSEKRILKKLIKLSNGEIKEFAIDDLPFKYDFYFMKKLFSKNLINIRTEAKFIEIGNIEETTKISLTEYGLKYFKETTERNFNELKSFLIKSFFVPVVVSSLTTLLTMWVKSFF